MAPLTDYLILDISTAAIPEAAQFIEEPTPHGSIKDPVKIAADIAAKKLTAIERCGLDPDLCQITGVAWTSPTDNGNYLAKNGHTEAKCITAALRAFNPNTVLIGFNSLKFDWPVLMRRCQYLGLPAPAINLDKYRTPHIDLFDRLTHHGAISGHSLRFYAQRLGWSDLVKPLSGEEESKVLETGKWDELAASLRHDVEATRRLAQWLGVIA